MKTGNGVAFNLAQTTQFNLTERIALFVEPGFFFSHQKYDDGSDQNISTLNIDLGVGYRFK